MTATQPNSREFGEQTSTSAVGSPPPAYGTPYAPAHGQPPYGTPPVPYGAPYGAPVARQAGRGLTIAAFVLAALALLIVPILFGPAAIICAGVAMGKGDPLAKWALGAGIAGMVLGMILGVVVLAAGGGF